jgi:hypothetical protein
LIEHSLLELSAGQRELEDQSSTVSIRKEPYLSGREKINWLCWHPHVPSAFAVARNFRGGKLSCDLGENPASEEAGYNNAVGSLEKGMNSRKMSIVPDKL